MALRGVTPPSVTIVYVVHDRRDELRTSLRMMLRESRYDGEVDAIVVDNASRDGSAEMVRDEFPEVELIRRGDNGGAPAWNEGYARARGDWVLTLDDDAYLPPDGLGRALAAAERHAADLVSFRVVSTRDPDWVFSDRYRAGLFAFWGCAWLARRSVLSELGGYDPEIFMWGNELDLTIRLYDASHRHLHLPEVEARHMKPPPRDLAVDTRGYETNARHWAYVAAKLLRPRDAIEALVALVARVLRDGLREDRALLASLMPTLRGFAHGLRHRRPVRSRELSRCYRRNCETFASIWWLTRPPAELASSLPREVARRALRGERRPEGIGRRETYFEDRARYYPTAAAALDFARSGVRPT
ncbi:MAG TPA: glycosyltransferase [Thermoleophilaceae bacterium]|nr:glycosyltransferase [Thermoleophilaceae bacterium]